MDRTEQRVKEIKQALSIFDSVEFDEAKHEYTYKGNKARISMTSLVSKHKQYFNQKWQAKRYAQKHNLIYEDVLAEWKYKAARSTTKGTAIHKYTELLFEGKADNSLPFVNWTSFDKYNITREHWTALTNQTDCFYIDACKNLILIATELKIFDPETGVGGAIDLLMYHPGSDELFMVDLKSSGEINKVNKYKKFMRKPLTHLPDINFVHYSLQLNGYQHIVQKVTGLKMRNNHFIAHVNEDQEKYQLIPTANLLKEMSELIDNFS